MMMQARRPPSQRPAEKALEALFWIYLSSTMPNSSTRKVRGSGVRLGGFKLLMFFQDENPPHVHLKGADFAAKIRISNGEILAGDAPRRVLKLARQWIQEHQASLVEQWNEFQR
jgi:hypothetical protein